MSVTTLRSAHTLEQSAVGTHTPTALLVPVARAFFAAIFLKTGLSHFEAGTIGYAASTGLPFASFLVPASGVLALLDASEPSVSGHEAIYQSMHPGI